MNQDCTVIRLNRSVSQLELWWFGVGLAIWNFLEDEKIKFDLPPIWNLSSVFNSDYSEKGNLLVNKKCTNTCSRGGVQMSSSQANSHRHSDTRTEPGVSREAPPLKSF